MSRLTVRLSEEHHRALKQEAVRRRTSMRQIVEESLEFYGVRTTENASTLVTAARQRSGLAEDDAMAVAVGETRAERVTADRESVAQQQLDGLLLEGLDSGPAEPGTEADVEEIRSTVREVLAKGRRADGADTQG